MGIIDELKELFNMSESQRRSHVGMDVAFWKANELGTIESFSPPFSTHPHATYFGESGSGVVAGRSLPDAVLGDNELERNQLMEMLRRSKMYLGMRKPDEELIKKLERRRTWNIASRPIENNLDLFVSVKYSNSCSMPCNKGRIDLVVSEKGKARFSGVAHSNNMRLDPVDAQKVAYKRRKEIQRAIQWGYDNGFIPVMMTLTVFHDWTWQPLTKIIAVLRKSYEDLFGHKVGGKLKDAIGFKYRIYRMEETIDMKNDLSCSKGSGKHDGKHGWHPHYHIVLFVPKDNLNILSDLEPKLKARWSKLVQKHYKTFVGEDIPESYMPALYKHGLMLSRYSRDVFDDDGNIIHEAGELYQVDDTIYLDKVMGCDSADVYGGDTELSSTLQKDSMSPFDLLRGKPTAEKCDLWNEYAVATKGLSCFRFTKGFKEVIDKYFEQHPDRDPVTNKLPKESVVATLKEEVYHLLYRNFKLKELKQKVSEGYESLCDWLKKLLIDWGLSEWAEQPFVLPRSP